MIDEEDYNTFVKNGYKFNISSHGYLRLLRQENDKWSFNYAHRKILNTDSKQIVDHINGNKLDNRKENLRLVSPAENARNAKAVNGFKGVFKSRNSWIAQITKNYKCYHLGSFKTEIEAAKAYNEKAKIMHGEYARLNVI